MAERRPEGVPVVSFVGRSGSGKTTLLEKVIGELTRRGYRVATVKHHTHNSDVDVPGKDSWRHARAGAHQVILKGKGVVAAFKYRDDEPTLSDLLADVEDADIVLTEGFHREARVTIEVSRSECSGELVNDVETLFAVVSDHHAGNGGPPHFGINDYLGVVDVIERAFLKQGEVVK